MTYAADVVVVVRDTPLICVQSNISLFLIHLSVKYLSLRKESFDFWAMIIGITGERF